TSSRRRWAAPSGTGRGRRSPRRTSPRTSRACARRALPSRSRRSRRRSTISPRLVDGANVRPLEPLASVSEIARLLKTAPAPDVRTELDRLGGLGLAGAGVAALAFARGALALREGALDAAHAELTRASDLFDGEAARRARLLCRCEAWLAAIRRGPRSVY